MRSLIKDELRSLKTHFPNQTSPGFWTTVSATLKSPMQELPDYPGVLLLLSSPESSDTAQCLARRLSALSSKVLARPGLTPPPPSSLAVDCALLPPSPSLAKEQLTSLLHTCLSSGSAAALLHLELLHPLAALTLHAFADNSNAPYKQAVLVASLEEGRGEGECRLEQRAEHELRRRWLEELGHDKLAALLSRVVVNVVEVHREEVGTDCAW